MPAFRPERLLATTARSTFESLALLYAQPGPAAALALDGGAVCARVTFAGVASGTAIDGTLTLAVSDAVARALAENMLGVAHAGPDERRDAVGELANVVCGHVVSSAAGPEAVFRLCAPVTDDVRVPAGTWESWLDVEGGCAYVALDAPASLFAPEHGRDGVSLNPVST